MADLRLVDDLAELLGAQQRHRATAMPPAFITANQQATSIGLFADAQQHAVARHQPHFVDQHMGDAVGLAAAVRHSSSAGRRASSSADPVAAALVDMAIEQFAGAIEPLGKLQLGQFEQEFGLLLGRRQVVAREAVDMG